LGEIRDYNIDIYKLPNTKHEYQFIFNDSFWGNFENSLVSKGKGVVDLVLTKSPTFITLDFKISGSVELICDRSNEPFDFPLQIEKEIILKYGDDGQELSDTIEIIPWETQRINIGQYIYEFAGLEIPMKKLHPRFGNDDNEDEVVFSTKSDGDTIDNEDKVDPRWVALKKLKINKKDDGAS